MKNPDLKNLRKQFDRVMIAHFNPAVKQSKSKTNLEFFGTRAAIVKEGKVFVGISKLYRPDVKAIVAGRKPDQFNRRIGRQIAIGRALRAYAIHKGVLSVRKKDAERREPVGYTIDLEDKHVEEVLNTEIHLGVVLSKEKACSCG